MLVFGVWKDDLERTNADPDTEVQGQESILRPSCTELEA